jgi:hypothetical protein
LILLNLIEQSQTSRAHSLTDGSAGQHSPSNWNEDRCSCNEWLRYMHVDFSNPFTCGRFIKSREKGFVQSQHIRKKLPVKKVE